MGQAEIERLFGGPCGWLSSGWLDGLYGVSMQTVIELMSVLDGSNIDNRSF